MTRLVVEDSDSQYAEEYEDSLSALALASRTSHNWSTSYVATSCDFLLKSVVAVLAPLNAPNLNSLTLGCTYLSQKKSLIFSGPSLLFRGDMPRLSLLNVMNAPFPWHLRVSFQHLTELRVVHIQANEWFA
jgi:hypothetical protein